LKPSLSTACWCSPDQAGDGELAEKLEARGFSAAPLNGDIPQPQRERTIARLKAATSISSSRRTLRPAVSMWIAWVTW